MIPIHTNIKNFGLTSFQRSFITRNGITKNTSLIWNGGMVKKSNLFSAGANVILTATVPAHAVMPQNSISTKTMVPKGSSSAKYVPLPFHQKKTVCQTVFSEMSLLQPFSGSNKRPETLCCT